MPPVNPYLALIVGVMGVSASAILVKLTSAPPTVIAFYRLFFAFLLLVPFVIRYNLKDFKKVSGKVYTLTFSSGLFLAFHFITWFASLKFTSVASSTVLVNTQPVFVLILSLIIFKETFSFKSYSALITTLAGTLILGWNDLKFGVTYLKGDLLALIGAFLIVGYYIIGKYLRKTLDNLLYTFLVYGFSTVILLFFIIIGPYSLINYSKWDFFIFFNLAFFCTILGHSILNWSLKYLPTTSVSISVLGEPVIASILAFIIFKESLSFKQLLGCLIILIGIYNFLLSKKN